MRAMLEYSFPSHVIENPHFWQNRPEMTPLSTLDVEVRTIGAHHIQRQQVPGRDDRGSLRLNENVGVDLTRRAIRGIVSDEEFRDRRRNRGMIEHAIVHCISRNPGETRIVGTRTPKRSK